jgi:hypothetical protein
VPQEIDDLGVESYATRADPDFDAWVRRRLAGWTTAEIRAFEHWLFEDSRFEFIPAVHKAWRRKGLEESDSFDSREPAA